MPNNNSPKIPNKRGPYRTPHRLSLSSPSSSLPSPSLSSSSSSLSSKSPRFPSSSSLSSKSPRLFVSVPSQFNPTTTNNKNTKKKKKKKKTCYSSCCCMMFVGLLSFLLVFILQESWDPDGELAVRFLENEVFQDITGPNVELPGAKLAKQGLGAHFPVVFIPGIVSTGLEVWQGTPCAQKHFRQRFWGTGLMLRKILLAKQCWLQHIMLTQEWTDPPGIKLRPAQGLVAADYLVADYWVWARVIENLAYMGYDESNMFMASYDWRLPFRMLESRDRYFTRLKANIELLRITNNHTRVALVAHSMGSNVVLYFLRWVENNFGSLWVEKNVEVFVNIGGPLLGVSKTISSLISGEMRDTAELNPTLQFIKENFLSKEDLMHLFRSFGSLPSMMPKGFWPGPIVKIREDHIPKLRTLMAEKEKIEKEEAELKKKHEEEELKKKLEEAEQATNKSIDETSPPTTTTTTTNISKENTTNSTKIDNNNNNNNNNTTEQNVESNTTKAKETKNETSEKTEDSEKSVKSDNSEKSEKSEKSKNEKSEKSENEKSEKSEKSKNEKSETEKSEKSEHPEIDNPPHEIKNKKAGEKGKITEETETTVEDQINSNKAPKPEKIETTSSPQEIRADVPLPPYVNFTVAQALELLREISPGYMELLEEFYDLGFKQSHIDLHDEKQWVNPLLTPLPQASMKVYCMYGVGKPTEYSYYYRPSPSPTLPVEIDTTVNEEDVFHGVVMGEGDGTVPLLSLGYMCSKGWKNKELNPGGVPIVTREYQHSVMSLLEGARAGFDGLRGGYGTADHVDIMGNHHMLEDLSKILSNSLLDEVTNQFYSNIEHLVEEVEFDSVKTVK